MIKGGTYYGNQSYQALVKPGDTVKARDNLGTMEAMKMEQPIPCPKDGVVKDVLVSVGDKVKSGAVLLSIE